MDDKTISSLQPSTTFDDSTSSTIHPFTGPLTFSSTYPSISTNTIISGINQLDTMERKTQFDIQNSLMSPPEPTPQDSFSRASPGASTDSKMKTAYSIPVGRFQPPLSPPISPASKNVNPDDAPSLVVRDPILFPSQPVQNTASESPLFNVEETLATQRVVNGHVAARESSMFREASPPRQDEYELALEFKAEVAHAFSKNQREWLKRERAYLLEDRALQSGGGRRYTNIAPAANGSRPRGQISKQPSRQPKPVRHHASKPLGSSATPDPVKRVAREDKEFNSLPDFCPPVSSLPAKANSLKVDWKGAPIDLRFDPHVNLLHPDEVLLAANLRLDCATYLTSKRRIFIKRIEALRNGKEFRKTDAQQACKIDVNKASKLWQAFEKVGWLEPRWVRQYA